MNEQFLAEAQAAAQVADAIYQAADILTKLRMKPDRDMAFERIETIRLQIISGQIVLTQENLSEMCGIRAEISAAADTQSRLIALGKLATTLGKHLVC
jgi:hypothetical protein